VGVAVAERLTHRKKKNRKAGDRSAWRLFLNQICNPLVILLLVAMIISHALGERMDVLIVRVVVLMSTLLGFWQKFRAASAVASLLAVIQMKTTVLRDGKLSDVPVEEIVPGDVVFLSAGDTIPGDGLLIESKVLFVDESDLTSNSSPALRKQARPTSCDSDALGCRWHLDIALHLAWERLRTCAAALDFHAHSGHHHASLSDGQ
jgi:Mg2+-importing ATPase